MNTTARSLLSGATFVGLVAFLGYAIAVHGLTSEAAILGFSLITMQGLAEIAIISYAPAPRLRGRMKIALASRRVAATPRVVTVAEPRATAQRSRTASSGVLVA